VKTKEQCVEILGKELSNKVEQTLLSKGINDGTINRALDYLAIHKQAFPFIDITEIAMNLSSNLCESIIYPRMKESFRGLFRCKAYGWSTGREVVINTKPLRIVLPSKHYNVMLDALIRHEFDHLATTRFKRLTKEQYKAHISKNIDLYNLLCDTQPIDEDLKEKIINETADNRFLGTVIENGRKVKKEKKATFLRRTGVAGEINAYKIANHLGSTAFNEGITAYKMKIMDKFAGQGGLMCQSGYILGEEVAKHFADVIGEEEFITMQTYCDFEGIVKRYQEITGKSYKEIQKMFRLMDEKPYKSAFSKLFAQVRYSVSKRLDKNAQKLYDEIVNQGEEFQLPY